MTSHQPHPVDLPAALRERVLQESLRARARGHTVPAPAQISPVEAFGRAADAFYGLLCVLTPADWARPALRDLDVQGLVGHLIGVEADMHRCLAGDVTVAEASHVGSTQHAAVREAGRAPEVTRAEWRRAVDRTLALVRAAGDLDVAAAVHGMRLPLRALLVVRAFELWVHDNDIRSAAGLPPSVPDPATLRLMTDLAAGLLAGAATRAGFGAPASLHLVLTGPGGGTWDLALGEGHAAPEAITIVTDAVGFCRLVANRITPAELGPHIAGHRDSAAAVLAAAATLALD
jgi:uncharacterized protein (TIGR03083 family)